MRKLLSILSSRMFLTGIVILIQLFLFMSFWLWLVEFSVLEGAVLTFLSLVIVVYIISKNEAPAYKMGWVVIIMLLPVFGGMLYLVFGNKRPARKIKGKIDACHKAYKPFLKPNEDVEGEIGGLDPRFRGKAHYLQHTVSAPAWSGTDTKYYALGEEMFEDMLADLKTAKSFIFLEFFIIGKGEFWNGILEVLASKAKEGVDVRLIYDDVGCLGLLPRTYPHEMEKLGIKCFAFNPFVPVMSLAMNHRDHRKIMVIDGKTGYTGGVNIADEYINTKVKYGHWKDTGIRMEGPGVRNLTIMFLEMWNAFREEDADIRGFLPDPSPSEGSGKGFVIPFEDSPLDDELTGQNVYLDIINQARDYVYIFTPYLIIDHELQNAMVMAAKRGVDIRLVTPGIPDKKLVYRVTQSFYPELLASGVLIYKYTPGFMHAKSFVSDDKVAVVGTINLDFRSLCLHFECGVCLFMTPTVMDVKADCLKTFAVSDKLDAATYHQGKAWAVIDRLIRVFSPLM